MHAPGARAALGSVASPLIEPSARISDPAARREARLLSILLLVMVAVFACVDAIQSARDPGYEPPWYGYLFLLGSYALARTAWFKVAAVLAVMMFPVVTFATLLSGASRDPAATLSYLVLSPALASIFLPLRGVVALGLLNVVGIVVSPTWAPNSVPRLAELVAPLSANVIAIALAAVLLRHRSGIERDRRAELEAEKARLDLALESAHMGTGDWFRSSDRAVVSPELEAIFGLAPKSSNGDPQALLAQVIEGDREAIVREVSAAIEHGGDDLEATFRVRWADGAVHWVLAKARLTRDAHGRVERITGVGVDFTERRRLEDQLRQAQKMEVVGSLAGGVAHDFNNILTVILGNVDILTRRQPSRELSEIANAAHSASSFTRQLLALSRQGVLRPKVIDLNEALRTGVSMLRRVIGENIEAVFLPEPELWTIKADEGQIQQIVLNLATNARDAMPDGGTLTIATHNASLASPPGTVYGTFTPGDYAVVTVTDTGTGMDPATRDRVFEPFFTTKDVGRGTGLGLASVLGIVSQGDGFITLDSKPGLGSMFAVHFPRAEKLVRQAPDRERAAPSGTELLLLVEDDARIRSICRDALEIAGYSVLEAALASDALGLWRSHKDGIHLLLSDVVMPGLSGVELAERLLEEKPTLRVILMSGYAPQSSDRRRSAYAPFLQKPFTPEELLNKVRAVLDGRDTPTNLEPLLEEPKSTPAPRSRKPLG